VTYRLCARLVRHLEFDGHRRWRREAAQAADDLGPSSGGNAIHEPTTPAIGVSEWGAVPRLAVFHGSRGWFVFGEPLDEGWRALDRCAWTV